MFDADEQQHGKEGPVEDADGERQRFQRLSNGTSNCFTDCSVPSECFLTLAFSSVFDAFDHPSSSPTVKQQRKARKYSRRDSFQKVPSPLSKEWHVDAVLDEEANLDTMDQIVKGRRLERL
ncbi:hypothetical protein ACQKWADRAFT_297861 [Trichoderma austrokoningii]